MRTVALLGLLLLPLIVASCGKSAAAAKEQVAVMTAKDTAVTSLTTAPSVYQEVLAQPGTTYAIRDIELEPRVSGYIESVDFADGSLVKGGDLLFQIDPRPYEAALVEARGNLESSIAARNLAAHNVERNRPLVETGAVSREQFDTYVSTLEQYEGQVEASAGQLVEAELNLGFTMIRAPFEGRVGQRQVEVGDLVQSTSSTQLVSLVQYQPMRVLISVPADQLERLTALQAKGLISAQVRVNGTRGGGGKVFDGEVDFINNQVNQMTSTVMVRVRFDNPDAWAYPGQYAEVELDVGTIPDAIVIPEESVRIEQGGTKYVWLISSKDTISRQDVTVSTARNGKVWVQKGLRAGQLIVIDGGSGLVAGDHVTIKPRITQSEAKDETEKSAGKSAGSSSSTSSSKGSSGSGGSGSGTSGNSGKGGATEASPGNSSSKN